MKPKILLIILAVIVIDLAALWWWRAYQLDHSQDATIIAAASIYEMDPALIKAVIWRESRFNPKARGAAGELGLMQIRDVAAGEWAKAEGITNFHHNQLIDSKSNVLAGTWYLKKAISHHQHTDKPIIYGLAEYNAGRSNVLKWNSGDAATNSVAFIEAIEFPSTRDYILSIQEKRKKYRDLH
ncbi:MAG: lytic transglycosylase domain-containing protein [Verrucomicrobiota bacterium]|nr:lytic transglycosylase domain-containing protein [Verrucomicrobiota bacterium]